MTLTIEDLQTLAQEISARLLEGQKEILTSDEAAEYLGIAKQTLDRLAMNKDLPYYKPSGKARYFKRSELDAWIEKSRVMTTEEIKMKAVGYCLRNPLSVRGRGRTGNNRSADR